MNTSSPKIKTSIHMLKRKLKKLNFYQSALWAINKLSYVENKGIINAPEWAPWYLLYYLRLSAKYNLSKTLKSEKDVFSTYAYYDAYIKYSSDSYLNAQSQDLTRFFLRLPHQQFLYQTRLTGLRYKLARQVLFFSDFDKVLKKHYRLNSKDFLKLSFFLFSIFENKQRMFEKDIFNSFQNPDYKIIESYLETISMIPKELIYYCKHHTDFKETAIYDNFIFMRKPVLRLKNTHYLISQAFFCNIVAYGLYDLIKKEKSIRHIFGQKFENYAQERIASLYSPSSFLSEENIQERVPKGHRPPTKVDNIIPLKNINIFVECKATELPENICIQPTDENLSILQRNLIKAIKQSYKCCQYITKNKEKFPEVNPRNRNFVLIVTYKETYLRNAENIWGLFKDTINKESIQNFLDISLNDIFFITIDDFDWLLSLGENVETVMIEASEKFRNREAFTFTDVLKEHLKRSSKLPHLEDCADKIIKECYLELGGEEELYPNLKS